MPAAEFKIFQLAGKNPASQICTGDLPVPAFSKTGNAFFFGTLFQKWKIHKKLQPDALATMLRRELIAPVHSVACDLSALNGKRKAGNAIVLPCEPVLIGVKYIFDRFVL